MYDNQLQQVVCETGQHGPLNIYSLEFEHLFIKALGQQRLRVDLERFLGDNGRSADYLYCIKQKLCLPNLYCEKQRAQTRVETTLRALNFPVLRKTMLSITKEANKGLIREWATEQIRPWRHTLPHYYRAFRAYNGCQIYNLLETSTYERPTIHSEL